MTGIFGMVSKSPFELCKKITKNMYEAQNYEPFYRKGIFLDKDMFCYVGWNCHKDSFCTAVAVVDDQAQGVGFELVGGVALSGSG